MLGLFVRMAAWRGQGRTVVVCDEGEDVRGRVEQDDILEAAKGV